MFSKLLRQPDMRRMYGNDFGEKNLSLNLPYGAQVKDASSNQIVPALALNWNTTCTIV